MSEAAASERTYTAVGTLPYGMASIPSQPPAPVLSQTAAKTPQAKMTLLPNVVYRALLRSRRG